MVAAVDVCICAPKTCVRVGVIINDENWTLHVRVCVHEAIKNRVCIHITHTCTARESKYIYSPRRHRKSIVYPLTDAMSTTEREYDFFSKTQYQINRGIYTDILYDSVLQCGATTVAAAVFDSP